MLRDFYETLLAYFFSAPSTPSAEQLTKTLQNIVKKREEHDLKLLQMEQQVLQLNQQFQALKQQKEELEQVNLL